MVRVAPDMPSRLARCAFEVFAERGFTEATIDDITARARVTKGSFYSHYQSKQQVILASCNYYYRTYQTRVHAHLASFTSPLERLQAALEFSVRMCVLDKQCRVFTTEIFARSLQDEIVRASWSQFFDTVRQMYLQLVQAALTSRRKRTPPAAEAVELMLAAMEGIKLRATFEPQLAARSEQTKLVTGLMSILGFPCSQQISEGCK